MGERGVVLHTSWRVWSRGKQFWVIFLCIVDDVYLWPTISQVANISVGINSRLVMVGPVIVLD